MALLIIPDPSPLRKEPCMHIPQPISGVSPMPASGWIVYFPRPPGAGDMSTKAAFKPCAEPCSHELCHGVAASTEGQLVCDASLSIDYHNLHPRPHRLRLPLFMGLSAPYPECFRWYRLIRTQADPLMGRAYLNVRATGGAVKSLAKDWRGI